ASVVFFFQAEDGIRARNVTGVQTCALPISPASPTPVLRRHERPWAAVASTGSGSAPARLGRGTAVPVPPRLAAEEMNAREGRPAPYLCPGTDRPRPAHARRPRAGPVVLQSKSAPPNSPASATVGRGGSCTRRGV